MTNKTPRSAARFNRLAAALRWAEACERSRWVVTDGASFFVVRPVEAARLERIGFAIVTTESEENYLEPKGDPC